MDALTYLILQIELEGTGLAGEHTIRQVREVPGEELPLMLLAQLADPGLVAYYDESLSADLRSQIRECVSSIIFPDIEPILNILASHNIQVEPGHYKTYVCSPHTTADAEVICLLEHDLKIRAFGFDGFAEQIYVVERNDRILSACVSVREDNNCGEAWVYTEPEYRIKGLAKKVVNAWARSLVNKGKIPFYSHNIDNLPSARLAEALELQPVFEEVSISRKSK
jgi:RimJ/RimL family protein N-acetyltransferase